MKRPASTAARRPARCLRYQLKLVELFPFEADEAGLELRPVMLHQRADPPAVPAPNADFLLTIDDQPSATGLHAPRALGTGQLVASTGDSVKPAR